MLQNDPNFIREAKLPSSVIIKLCKAQQLQLFSVINQSPTQILITYQNYSVIQ